MAAAPPSSSSDVVPDSYVKREVSTPTKHADPHLLPSLVAHAKMLGELPDKIDLVTPPRNVKKARTMNHHEEDQEAAPTDLEDEDQDMPDQEE